MHQISKLIAGFSIKQRITIVAATLVAGLLVTGLVHWKHESGFSALYTGMAPEDAAGVVQKLKETGVEYRLGDGGGTVRVPSARLAESRLALAAAGLPKSGRIGFELFDKSNFGTTDFVEHINYKRALEGELERSVMSLAEVEQARVHLTLPKESVFLDQQQPSKASVMVKLHPGAHLSPQNVLAITNLVASAVEGLSPDAISVVDMNGTLLTRRASTASADGSQAPTELMEMRQQIEHNLVAKISETLDPLLGPNAYRAGASVDFDLTSGDQQEETFDPTHSVMASSQKSEDVSDRGLSSSGIPGTASNLPGAAVPSKASAGGVSRRTENITYQTSRMIRHTRIPQGMIKRMSLSVLVDQAVRWDGGGPQKHRVLVPPAPETLKTIKDLVAGVTGFSAERGDQLVVETLPFESSQNAEPPESPSSSPVTKDPPWLRWFNQYRTYISAAVTALAILFVVARVLLKVMRRRPPVAVSQAAELESPMEAPKLEPATTALATAEQLAGHTDLVSVEEDSQELAKRIFDLAKREPAVAANALRMWLLENQAAKSGAQHA